LNEAVPSPEVVRAWRSIRRSRARWRGLGVVAWVALAAVSVALGDSPDAPGADDWPTGRIRGSGDGMTAGLVVSRLRGWPAGREEHVARRLPLRMRGSGATVRGRLYRSKSDLVWIPDSPWRRLNARDLLLRDGDVGLLQFVPLGRQSGLTVTLCDEAEVWLLLGRQLGSLADLRPT